MSFIVFLGIIVLFIWGAGVLGARQRARMLAGVGPRRGSGAFAKGCVALGFGMIMLIIVIGIGLPTLRETQNDLAFAQNHPPVPQLTAAAVGDTVLVQGAISPQTAAAKWGFVAFDRFERSGRSSRLAESQRPPFKVALPGQQIQIENPAEPSRADYRIDNQAEHPDSSRIRGLLPNDQVLAVGTVRSGPNGLYLDAANVYRGDYAGYLGFLRGSISHNGISNVALAATSGVCLLLCVAAWRKAAAGRRQG